ncbi:MAG: leucyl aminopeptidase [Nanoarchaeota archaeon]|nr:leucyl aminopeptidase [Nanoarchaeota archaeon]
MKININKDLDKKAEVLILGLFEEDTKYHKDLEKELETAIKKKQFTKKLGSTYFSKLPDYNKVFVFGLGKKEEFTLEKLRRIMAKCLKTTKGHKYTSFTTNIPSLKDFNAKDAGHATAEGIILSDYKFNKYITPKENEPEIEIETITIQTSKENEFLAGVKEGTTIANAITFARDMVNEPAMVATPSYLENKAKEIAKLKNVTLKVLNKADMKKEGMGGILGVTAGSDQDPKLIILTYNGAGKEKYTAIVGKGITFDSGGYNIKPTGYMETMKCDMSGAAAVLATIKGATELGLKKNIIALAPACENLVNGSGYKPGDILTAYNKKTIEIGNTDAEGRLVLADALSYADKNYNPEIIIDLATLTGACVVALGEQISGLMTKDDILAKDLEKAGEESYDRVWRLPMLEEYMDSMKGSISDLKNIAPKGYGAGTITAGIFLSHFVEKARWAHIDIAGPAFIGKEKDYTTEGGTGAGVHLLLKYFSS